MTGGYLLGFKGAITELDMTANDDELGETTIASVTRTVWVDDFWNSIDVGLKGVGGDTCVKMDWAVGDVTAFVLEKRDFCVLVDTIFKLT